jgi:transcription elongation factor GreA
MQKITPILFTPEGINKLKQEQEQLLSTRPVAVEELRKAREMGDLSENAFYKTARQKLSGIDSRLRRLNHLLLAARKIIPTDKSKVGFGCFVQLQSNSKKYTYQIVGSYEADPFKGKISYISPLGSALVGKCIGDTASLELPTGIVNYQVKDISLTQQ